jgi:hypothetical protein
MDKPVDGQSLTLALPLVWGLSRPNERGERTTFHEGGEGVVRVVELEPVLDLLEGLLVKSRLSPDAGDAGVDLLRSHGRLPA